MESGQKGSNPSHQETNRSLSNRRKETGWSYSNHLAEIAESAAAAVNKAAANKISKYSTLAMTHHFVPISVETGGPWNPESFEFIAKLGKRISQITLEPLETQFVFQTLSISLHRGNELAFRNTFLAE